jgi:glycerate kinase
VEVTDLPGGGAAGGLAGGLAALGARLVPGFGVVAEAVRLTPRLAAVDVVVTGEGRLDATSWSGKVVGSVVAAASAAGVPVLVVVGVVGPGGIEGTAGADVEVRTLADRFGAQRALADPGACVEVVVADALGEFFGG